MLLALSTNFLSRLRFPTVCQNAKILRLWNFEETKKNSKKNGECSSEQTDRTPLLKRRGSLWEL